MSDILFAVAVCHVCVPYHTFQKSHALCLYFCTIAESIVFSSIFFLLLKFITVPSLSASWGIAEPGNLYSIDKHSALHKGYCLWFFTCKAHLRSWSSGIEVRWIIAC